MKRNYVYALRFALIGAVILTGIVSAFSQKTGLSDAPFAVETRPFDFSDKYYYGNGVEPSLIVNRHDGKNGQSVFETIDDARFRNIRILSVYPAYDHDGRMIFWNLYGEVFKNGFAPGADGDQTRENAHLYPLYIFPSKDYEYEFRQPHIINLRDDAYYTKNPLGLSAQVVVEYTDLIYTDEGQKEMAMLIEKNGVSADGTPVIKTALEIEELTQKNYITQKLKGLENPNLPDFAIARVMRNPQGGAIAPDAFLLNTLGVKVDPVFAQQFECLQTQGNWCDK